MEHFQLHRHFAMVPRYNIAPSHVIPVIRDYGDHKLDFLQWGFLPHWAKEPLLSPHINARVETASEKPSFRHAFKAKRCLIPASGYFEWMDLNGKKQPFYVHSEKNPLLAFAGLWDKHNETETVLILTKVAQGEVLRVHERMPVVLECKDYDAWLNPKSSVDSLASLWENEIEWRVNPVSLKVNNPLFDNASCIASLT